MNRKYEFTGETRTWTGRTLHRIRAVRDFGDVKAGDLGGWIEKESNLSHDGNAMVYGDAEVYGNARVSGNAMVFDDAKVYGNARVYGNAEVCNDARVYGNACVCYNAWVYGNADVYSAYAIMTVSNVGSRNDTTTFFARKDKQIGVTCGCFRGTIDEFEAAVKKTHGDNEHGKVYMLAIEMAKLRIKFPEESKEKE